MKHEIRMLKMKIKELEFKFQDPNQPNDTCRSDENGMGDVC